MAPAIFCSGGIPAPPTSMMGPPLPCLILLLCFTLTFPDHSHAMELPAVTLSDPNLALALDVTFDPRTWSLYWECQENITVTSCVATEPLLSEGKPRHRRIRARNCVCQFQPMVLHRGLTLEVNGTINNQPAYRKLNYVNTGLEGSAAENVTCIIRDASIMTCNWRVGPTAPDDVRYFLYFRDASSRGGVAARECPTYLGTDAHHGCRVDDLSLLPHRIYIIVTGVSQEAEVRFHDVILNSKLIEQLSPPSDVTVTCNASHCEVTWSRPRTWARLSFRDFHYEVDVQRQDVEPGSWNPMVRISSEEQNHFIFLSPEPRPGHVLRLRAGDVRSERWSDWSPPLTFGCQESRIPTMNLYLLLAAGTLLCTLGLGLLSKRFVRTCELLPRIPEIRDKVTDNDQVNSEILRKDILLVL